MDILIIGYGNDLRSDDGVGKKVVSKISELNLPNTKTLILHQLYPELSELLSKSDLVFFVDAHLISEDKIVRILPIEPSKKEIFSSHIEDPAILISLSKELYRYFPKAYWVTVPAINFEFGETFSEITRKGMEEAIKSIVKIIKDIS